jgi:hypothetical protein
LVGVALLYPSNSTKKALAAEGIAAGSQNMCVMTEAIEQSGGEFFVTIRMPAIIKWTGGSQ